MSRQHKFYVKRPGFTGKIQDTTPSTDNVTSKINLLYTMCPIFFIETLFPLTSFVSPSSPI